MKNTIRVRFAPAPTGMMHLGNVRAALMNYLFAQQTGGTFVLRIEDTDGERNYDPEAKHIINDLTWLGLTYNEGPEKDGGFGPYFQSQRNDIYKAKLKELQHTSHVYRCFCSIEELEKKRLRQIALKLPPRYDRACLALSQQTIDKNLAESKPFVWRVKLDTTKQVTIHDLAHGDITFDLKNFSDFPITRQDGSFTFMFSNCIDDIMMEISHIFRGEDHLTNTAGQAYLFPLFGRSVPVYWHMPILCNLDGKKLSKRDFGFSLNDLRNAGYLPQAIVNYLATIGGGNFPQEIMSLSELAQAYNFNHIHSTGHIRYDNEKLRWMNHVWMQKLTPEEFYTLAKPYLLAAYPDAIKIGDVTLQHALQTVKTDITTLDQCPQELAFYFEKPKITSEMLQTVCPAELHASMKHALHACIQHLHEGTMHLKKIAHDSAIPMKVLYQTLRIGLTGKPDGLGIQELITLLGMKETQVRLAALLSLIELK